MTRKFFAIVGSPLTGKNTLFQMLKATLPQEEYVFLTDSGNGSEFTKCLSELAKRGVHKQARPLAQLAFFWARLVESIEVGVTPNLKAGKTVIMKGFGGTILTHVLSQAPREDWDRLIAYHKAQIDSCVLGTGAIPPLYIQTITPPEVVIERHRVEGNVVTLAPDIATHITRMDELFRFYGELPGQQFTQVSGNQSPEAMLEEALSIIRPSVPTALAA